MGHLSTEEIVAALVSDRVGLVRDLAPQPRGPEEPVPPYLYTADLSHFDFRMAPRSERLNAGKGRTPDEARLSALGEAVERYSAYHWDAKRVVVGPADATAITPQDCVLYSPAQYAAGLPYARWAVGDDASWIDGVELLSGTAVQVPAALAYLVNPLPRFEDHVTTITSNGLSAGATLEQAVLGGLYEVIERDALMITWLNRLPATTIRTPDTGCEAAAIIRHYRWQNVTIRLFLIHTDQLPTVVMAVAENPPGVLPLRGVGMGCDIDPVVAVDKAVFEMCQARPSEAARFRAQNPAERLKTYADVTEIDDHPGFHALPRNAHEFDFLSATGASVELGDLDRHGSPDPASALIEVAERLRETGARVAYADITAPDVRSVGIHVVRAFATGLQPIHFGYGEGRFGGRRLFDAPVRWGLRTTPLTEDALNLCPHPLA